MFRHCKPYIYLKFLYYILQYVQMIVVSSIVYRIPHQSFDYFNFVYTKYCSKESVLPSSRKQRSSIMKLLPLMCTTDCVKELVCSPNNSLNQFKSPAITLSIHSLYHCKIEGIGPPFWVGSSYGYLFLDELRLILTIDETLELSSTKKYLLGDVLFGGW